MLIFRNIGWSSLNLENSKVPRASFITHALQTYKILRVCIESSFWEPKVWQNSLSGWLTFRPQWVWEQSLQSRVCQRLWLLPVLLPPRLPAEWCRWIYVWRYVQYIKTDLIFLKFELNWHAFSFLRHWRVCFAHWRTHLFLPLPQHTRQLPLHMPC